MTVANREYAELINLAAELARGDGLPTCFDEDNFYKSTPVAERRRVRAALVKMENRCKDWAVRVRAVADRLSET